jgi:hypothetical protein
MSIFYVDLSLPTDVNYDVNDWRYYAPAYIHAGTEIDPFNHRNFRDYCFENSEDVNFPHGRYYWGNNGNPWLNWNAVDSRNDTFYIKGSIDATTVLGNLNNPFLITAPGNGQSFLPWNPVINGPYKIIRAGGSNGSYGTWSGGFIWHTSAHEYSAGSLVVSCHLWNGDNAQFYLDGQNNSYIAGHLQFGSGAIIKGSTLRCNELWLLDTAVPPVFQDCMMIHPEQAGGHSGVTFNRCIFLTTRQGMVEQDFENMVDTDCQFGYTFPSTPAASSAKELFADSILLAGVSTPPLPGTLPYSGYSTDLWGNPRYSPGGCFNSPLSPSKTRINLIYGD